MINKWPVLLIIFLTGFITDAGAVIYEVPLAVNGRYSAGDRIDFIFDLGVELIAIDSVQFYCKGEVTAGLSFRSTPFSWMFEAWLPASPGYWIARSPSVGDSTYPLAEPFEDTSTFTDLLSPTWDFLLDGKSDGWVELPVVMHIPEEPPLIMPSGQIESAKLIISASPLHEISALDPLNIAVLISLISITVLISGKSRLYS